MWIMQLSSVHVNRVTVFEVEFPIVGYCRDHHDKSAKKFSANSSLPVKITYMEASNRQGSINDGFSCNMSYT